MDRCWRATESAGPRASTDPAPGGKRVRLPPGRRNRAARASAAATIAIARPIGGNFGI
jgi:hypothetical protein